MNEDFSHSLSFGMTYCEQAERVTTGDAHRLSFREEREIASDVERSKTWGTA
jgi:hypothetical protein